MTGARAGMGGWIIRNRERAPCRDPAPLILTGREF